MTLPVALLIACYKHESISDEILEIVGEKVSVMESLSCKCKDHISRLCLVPPSTCCSSDRTSPTSDRGSEISTGSFNTVKSYSYFSEVSDSDETLCINCPEQADVNLGRCLSVLVDLVENVTVRFNESYIFKQDEVKINYQKRDILDLGGNIKGQFPLKHPVPKKITIRNHSHERYVPKSCSIADCKFEDILPLNRPNKGT